MSYSYINREDSSSPSSEPETDSQKPNPPSSPTATDVFHARQIIYPVNVTVYHTLEFSNLDIIPLFPSSTASSASRPNPTTASSTNDLTTPLMGVPHSQEGDYCLVSVDVSNVYGLPFDVTLERHQEGMLSCLLDIRLDFLM